MTDKFDGRPITLARAERALDGLAVIITKHEDMAARLLPLYECMEKETEALRARKALVARVQQRAKRVRGRG